MKIASFNIDNINRHLAMLRLYLLIAKMDAAPLPR